MMTSSLVWLRLVQSKRLRRGDLDIAAYEDEHKFDGDGDDPA